MHLPASQTGHLFLAVLPDADTAKQIHRMAARVRDAHKLEGQLTACDRLHVTLLGLSDLPEAVVDAACAAVAELKTAPFDVSFDRTMSFRGKPGSRPFVLTGDAGLRLLKSFRQSVVAAVTRTGLVLVQRREFMPHVTLLFGDRAVEENPFWPIGWTVRDFVLVHSQRGHTHLMRWPLQL